MQDETTIDPELDLEGGESTWDPPVDRLLNARNGERYVPKDLRCENCGNTGADFDWFQRVPAGAAGEGIPGTDLYFCDVVCLGAYSGDHLDGYTPDVNPVSVEYD